MEGAFVSRDCGPGPNMARPCHWIDTYDNRTQRRTGNSMIRGAHDYQRISMDFGGTVSFPSDQGLFIMPTDGSVELIKANGNMSNNIALKAAISKGDGTGPDGRYIVTAVWDWAPLASWDNGAHWPSWQTPADGTSGSCIGEGGGAYAMGASNHMLLMHHHNVLGSAQGGKNLTRWISPHGSTVFGPAYQTKEGSNSEPSGTVFAPLFMPPLPWVTHFDKMPKGDANCTDIGLHTNYSCLAAADLGVTYGKIKSVDYAVWRGDVDRHCHTCSLAGNSSTWDYAPQKGAISYSRIAKASDRSIAMMMEFDLDGDGEVSDHDLALSMVNVEKLPHKPPHSNSDRGRFPDVGDAKAERVAREFRGDFSDSVKSGGASLAYVLKDPTGFGQGPNWTYTVLPPHMQSIHGFLTGPMVNGSATLYGMDAACITRSFDQGDTWTPCWNAPPPPPATDKLGFHVTPGAMFAGNDLKVANLTMNAAEEWCHAQANCSGFTTLAAGGADAVHKVYFKAKPTGGNGDAAWVTYTKVPKPVGPPPPHGNATGLVGPFDDLIIKDAETMIATRTGNVPLKTVDGGKNWTPMPSCAAVSSFGHDMIYSWSRKTLIMMGSGGTQTKDHWHAPFVWVSKDDGETWTDETGDLVTMGPGAANWYEGDFYINSMGQGIQVKRLE